MKFYQTEIWGFSHALRSMRNPSNSWSNSDTCYLSDGTLYIGQNDLDFIKSAIQVNGYGCRFLKQIFVATDIIAPIYWWKEFEFMSEDSISVSCSVYSPESMKYTSLLEKRTVTLNYYDIRNIINQTKGSQMKEWSEDFLKWARGLPYAVPMIFNSSEESEKKKNENV